MIVTRERFQKLANHLCEKVVDRDNVEHDLWMESAPFCAMQYINDGRCLPVDEALQSECVRNVCKTNEEFYKKTSLDRPADF